MTDSSTDRFEFRGGSAGDKTQIYSRYQKTVRQTASFHGVPRADLDDITHEVFICALTRLSCVESPEHLRAWLRTTTKFQALNWRRGQKRRMTRAWEFLRRNTPPETQCADESYCQSDMLERVLDRLPQAQRQVIVKSVFDGHSVRAAAAQLGINPNTARSRMTLARASMARHLKCLGVGVTRG